jgi:hypothetical protein
MALTKLNTSGGQTGIPNPDPVSTDQGGPEGVGGSANTVNPPRVKATEPAGTGTPGAGSNTNLFNPWAGSGDSQPSQENSAPQGSQGASNVNAGYPAPNHQLTGTHLPTSTAGTGRIMRGGRGRPGK